MRPPPVGRAALAPPSPVRPARRLSLGKKLVFSVLVVSTALGLLEGAARVIEAWSPPMPVDYGLGFDADSRVFGPAPGKAGRMATREEKLPSFLAQEFAERKPASTLRIAAVGGSSVNYMEGEFRNMERNLKDEFGSRYARVEVLNFGGLSYGSHRLARVVAEALTYDPDVLVFYEAHNEFQEDEQLELASLELLGTQKAVYRSALARLIRDRITRMRIARLQRAHDARVSRQQSGLARSLPRLVSSRRRVYTKEEVAARMESYRRYLNRMVDLCEADRVPIVLATVPSNLVAPMLLEEDAARYRAVTDLIAAGDFPEASRRGREILNAALFRHQSSDRENAILRAVARERGVALADVEAAVIAAEPHHLPGESLFKDHCHLNDRGNAILRATLEREVRNALPPR